MLASLLVTLREGIEAFLIVAAGWLALAWWRDRDASPPTARTAPYIARQRTALRIDRKGDDVIDSQTNADALADRMVVMRRHQ
jgi:hypothetical protein